MIEYITFSNEVLSLVFFIGLVLNIMWVSELYTMKKAIRRALDKCQEEVETYRMHSIDEAKKQWMKTEENE